MLNNTLKVVLLLLIIGCQSKSEKEFFTFDRSEKVEPLTVGSNHILTSKILKEDRPIIISLPKGYEKGKANYPVLYLTDGLQNIWHVIGTVEVLTRTGSIPPIIVVGIESTNRTRDFSPTVSEDDPESGGGPKFLEFIENELITYIESNYRTHPFRVLEGHSFGGLFTAMALMEKPALFNAHIIMSPAFWWNKEESAVKAEAFFKSHQNLEAALFFGIGTYESETKWGMRKELNNFIDVIKANQPPKLRFEHKEIEKEGHMSSPLLSNYFGLKSIFSDMAFSETLYENYSDTAFIKHENKLISKYGQEAKQSAEEYVGLAFQLIDEKNLAGAITVLKRSVEAYDFDIGLKNLLANTYEKNNQVEMAISTYQEAISVSKKHKFGREKEFQLQIDRLKNN